MKRFLYVFAALALAACTKDYRTETAVIPFEVKASLQDGLKVKWQIGDKLAMFDAIGEKTEQTVNSTTGSFSISGKYDGNASPAYLAYPSSIEMEGGKFKAEVPAVQTESGKGTFPKGALVMLGKVSGSESAFAVQMKHACALLSFTLSTSNVSSVELSSADGTALAGQVEMAFSGNDPSVVSVITPSASVKLAAQSSVIYAGTYYVSVLPFKSNGMRIRLAMLDGTSRELSIDGEISASRGDVIGIGTLDQSDFKPLPDPDPKTPDPDPETDPDEPGPIDPDPDPSELFNLVLDFTGGNQPFTENLPTSAATTGPEGKSYYLSVDGTVYEFVIYNTTGGYRLNGSYLRLNDTAVVDQYDGAIKLPAIPGKRFYSITLTSGNAGSKTVALYADLGGAQLSSVSLPSKTATSMIYKSAAEGTSYWLSGGEKNIQYSRIVVSYR